MVRGPTDSTSPVAVFDGSILATVAVSAPHVMVKTAGAVLDGFGDLPEVDRRMLYETFRVWLDNDADEPRASQRMRARTTSGVSSSRPKLASSSRRSSM